MIEAKVLIKSLCDGGKLRKEMEEHTAELSGCIWEIELWVNKKKLYNDDIIKKLNNKTGYLMEDGSE